MKNKNKQTLIVGLIISLLMIVTLGISYSFFSYVKEGEKENTVELGSITFKYTENDTLGNGITITDAFPLSDSEGKSVTDTGKIFDFKVESTLSRSDLEYEVVAEPIESSTLPLDAIKFYLTDITSGEEVEISSSINDDGTVKTLDEYSDTLIENADGKTIYQETILKNTKGYLKQFRARMWISEDIDLSDENYIGKSGAIRINVYANSNRDMASTNVTTPQDTSIERVTANNMYLFAEVTGEEYQYTLTVPNEVDTVDIDVIPSNMDATVEVNAISRSFGLQVGENFFRAIVTSSDKSKSQEYTLRVVREKSDNTDLENLEVVGYELVPSYTDSTNLYEVIVPYDETTAEIVATKAVDVQSISGLGTKELELGSNEYEIIVTAENGIKRTIKITIIRKLSDDASINNVGVKGYSLAYLEDNIYTVTIPYSADSAEIINISTTGATVDGIGVKENLVVGNNDYIVKVISQSGLVSNDYVIRIIRDKDANNLLSSLSLTGCTLTPDFSSDITNYTCTLENDVTSTIVSATAMSSGASVSGTGEKSLSVGENTINVVVTAQNGIENVYTILVTRKQNSDATLSALGVIDQKISPTFDSETTAYTLSVPYNIDNITITGAATQSTSNVEGLGSKNLEVGKNIFNVVVTAEDKTTKTYKLTVTREKDTDNTLKNLSLTECTLSPTFDSEITSYTCTVENSVTSTIVSAEANSSVAIVTGTVEHSLVVGTNALNVTVTSQSGDIKTYQVVVTRKESSDATLSSLSVTGYTISPTFDSETTAYTLSVPYSVKSVEVNATANNSEASVTGTGNVSLNVGTNVVTVKVIAQDGITTKSYTITVTREQDTDATLKSLSLTNCTLSPTFDSETTSYSCTLENDITSTTISAEANSSVATVIGTGSQSLNVGTNTITVKVIAQDGTTTKFYNVTVTRLANSDASLSSLGVIDQEISPTFDKDILIYTLSVPYSIDNITIVGTATQSTSNVEGLGSKTLVVGDNTFNIVVTSENNTTRTYQLTVTREKDNDTSLKEIGVEGYDIVKVDDNHYTLTVDNDVESAVVYATATSNVATVKGTGNKNLVVGKNVIEVTVTSQSGIINIYEVAITRKASSDATLKNLTVSNGTLSPTFSSSTTSYSVTVPYSVTSLTVTPTVNNSEASYTISGNTNLVVGTNTIEVKVTAGDGTEKIYTITVTRSQDSTATLKTLSLTDCTLSPTFASGTTSYSCTVANSVTSTTVSASATSSVATVSGTGSKSLVIGENTITVKVIAQDGTVNPYTVIVTRKQSSDATLSALSVEGYTISPTFASGTTAYTVTTEATSVTINATVNDPQASVTGTGSKTLSWGTNTASVKVTAEDGTPKTYTITITNTRPTAPVITGGSSSWTSGNRTISVSTAGTAVSGVKHYEYYKTTSTTAPTDSTEATGTTSGSLTVSDSGITYIYYRTVSNNGNKSVWSSSQVVKKDVTTPAVTITGTVDSNTVTSSDVTLTGTVTPTSTISGYTYQWYQIPEYKYTSVTGFTVTSKTEDGEPYYNFSFTKTDGTDNSWYAIKFPQYTLTAGNTYKIHFKYRLNSISNTSFGFRHSAISNDWGTSGRVVHTVSSSTTKGTWIEAVITRTIPAQVTQSSTTYTSTPLLEIYTANLALTDTVTSKSVDFDLKDVWIEEVENSSNATVDNQLAQKVSNTTLSHTINTTSYSRYILSVKTGSGIVGSSNVYISKVDKDVPAAPTVSGGSTTLAGSRTFTLTAPSSKSGIASYEYYISSSKTTPDDDQTATGTSTSTSITINKTGTYIYFRAVNNVGTKGSWTSYQNLYVNTALLSSLSVSGYSISPTFASSTTSYTVTVPYSVTSLTVNKTTANSGATATVSGNSGFVVGTANTITIKVTGPDSTEKIYTIKVTRSKDTTNTLKSLSVTGYSLSPTFASGTTSYTLELEASSIEITAEATSSVATVSGDTGTQGLNWGTNTFTINVTSQSGSVKSYTITVTNTKPTAPTITGGSTTWSSTGKTITLATAGSAISGVKNYEYYRSSTSTAPTEATLADGTISNGTTATGTTSGGLNVSTQGTRYYWYRTVSNNGFKSAWSNYQIMKIDTSTPSIASVSGASTTWSASERAFTLTNNSSTSGIASAYYYVSSSTTAPTDKTLGTKCTSTTSCSVGTGKYVYFRIVNNAGTSSEWTSYYNNYVDTATPAAPGVSGTSTTWATSRTFTLTAPSSTSGIATYEYYVSSSTTKPDADQEATGTSTSTSIKVTTTGKYIYFRAINKAGTKGSWTTYKNLYVDTATPAAPKITGTSTTWAQSRTYTLTAPSSTSGISRYEYYIADETGLTPTTYTGYSTSTSITISGETGKYIYFRAVNKAGTEGSWSVAKNLYVDNTAPTCTFKVTATNNTLTSGVYTKAVPVSISLTVSDSDSGVKAFSYSFTNNNQEKESTLSSGTKSISTTSTSTSTTFTANYDGTSVVKLGYDGTLNNILKDNAGNTVTCTGTSSVTIKPSDTDSIFATSMINAQGVMTNNTYSSHNLAYLQLTNTSGGNLTVKTNFYASTADEAGLEPFDSLSSSTVSSGATYDLPAFSNYGKVLQHGYVAIEIESTNSSNFTYRNYIVEYITLIPELHSSYKNTLLLALTSGSLCTGCTVSSGTRFTLLTADQCNSDNFCKEDPKNANGYVALGKANIDLGVVSGGSYKNGSTAQNIHFHKSLFSDEVSEAIDLVGATHAREYAVYSVSTADNPLTIIWKKETE